MPAGFPGYGAAGFLRRPARHRREWGVESAVAAFIGAVQGLAATVFPWADRIRVHHSWSYEWWSATDEIELPPTEKNTVTEPAS